MSHVKSIADQLRQAIELAMQRGDTLGDISRKSGVSKAMLSRFMAGKHAPLLDTADKLFSALKRSPKIPH